MTPEQLETAARKLLELRGEKPHTVDYWLQQAMREISLFLQVQEAIDFARHEPEMDEFKRLALLAIGALIKSSDQTEVRVGEELMSRLYMEQQ